MIIGTAGHIDHGKSALLEALTGRPMDRLAEERRRGITIDLNFAPLDLGTGEVAGVVDVPGHEDFVRTMVAGAVGIDLVLLVIAADEGIMPQSREHLAIVEQLGVPSGVPVLTKIDLVDPDWLALVRDEVAAWLGRSPIPFGEPVPVSAVSGAGLDALRRRLVDSARGARRRAVADAFRLPVDRAFSVAGTGTVVTGTVWSGSVAVGDAVRLLPDGRAARVRTIETFGRPAERAVPGSRVALGLAGLDRDDARRGDVVVTAEDPWAASRMLDVRLALLPEAPQPLASRTRVRVHLGTAEVMARVYPRGGAVSQGSRGLARLALEGPLVARGGDRLVLRSYSPVTTIGGGTVLDPAPPRRAAWPEGLGAEDDAARLTALVERRPEGAAAEALGLLLGTDRERAEGLAQTSGALRRVGDRWRTAAAIGRAAARMLQAVDRFHARDPAAPGMPLETARRSARADPAVADAAIGDLVAEGVLAVEEGVARRPAFRPRAPGGEAAVDGIVARLRAAGLHPPSIAELEADGDARAALRVAAGRGLVVAVERERYYAAEALEELVQHLRALGADGPISVGALRERTGLSRKFLIPLLEWADARGVTRRVGDQRHLV